MEHFQATLDPRKQELLEARFLGARVSLPIAHARASFLFCILLLPHTKIFFFVICANVRLERGESSTLCKIMTLADDESSSAGRHSPSGLSPSLLIHYRLYRLRTAETGNWLVRHVIALVAVCRRSATCISSRKFSTYRSITCSGGRQRASPSTFIS